MPFALLERMRKVVAVLLTGAAFTASACATTPESRIRNEFLLDVYWTTARECEGQHRTVHVDSLLPGGDITLRADADSRMDLPGFRDCYWRGIQARVERRREAGQPVPDNANLRPDVDVD
jgi:hypothetical protein